MSIGISGLPNHSWNAVQLGGKWYLCDATWSSGVTYLPENVFVHQYNDGYFLADPELFAKSHYPLDTSYLLTKSKLSFHDFLNAPIVYGDTYRQHIIPLEPEILKLNIVKDEQVVFLLKIPDSTAAHGITVELVAGTTKSIIKPVSMENRQGVLELICNFEKAGYFDLHIKSEDKYIVSYVIQVNKKNRSSGDR